MELTANYISQKKNNKHEDIIELIQNERNIQKIDQRIIELFKIHKIYTKEKRIKKKHQLKPDNTGIISLLLL